MKKGVGSQRRGRREEELIKKKARGVKNGESIDLRVFF